MPSPQLMGSPIIVGPVDHAHGPGVIKSGHAVVALGKGQRDCHGPNEANYDLCGGGGEARLQGVDDGHVPERSTWRWSLRLQTLWSKSVHARHTKFKTPTYLKCCALRVHCAVKLFKCRRFASKFPQNTSKWQSAVQAEKSFLTSCIVKI